VRRGAAALDRLKFVGIERATCGGALFALQIPSSITGRTSAGYSGGGGSGGGSQQQGVYSGVTTDVGGYNGASGGYSKTATPTPRSMLVRPTAMQHSMQVPSAATQAAGNPGLQPPSAFAALRAGVPWLSQAGAAMGVIPPGLPGFLPSTWNPASAYGSPAAAQTLQQHAGESYATSTITGREQTLGSIGRT
jgi:hypothetical protein